MYRGFTLLILNIKGKFAERKGRCSKRGIWKVKEYEVIVFLGLIPTFLPAHGGWGWVEAQQLSNLNSNMLIDV